MLASYRTRRVFRIGAATHEGAMTVNDSKSYDMVQYLRLRRQIADPANHQFREQLLKNKAYVRWNHMQRKRAGLSPYRV